MDEAFEDKFVVMYSGNHSPCHPLNTLLEAAVKLRTSEDIAFCFVGGGSEFEKVKIFARDNSLANILYLPYQPRHELSGSLSAADLHVVVMGDAFKGLVHPCKIYNIVAIGAPVLYLGPAESHIGELIQMQANRLRAWSARHGAVDETVAHICAAVAAGPGRAPGAEEASAHFAARVLLPKMISILEQAGHEASLRAGPPGTRASIHVGDPRSYPLPRYLANLIVSENWAALGTPSGPAFVDYLFRPLRPYGGLACLALAPSEREAIIKQVADSGLAGEAVGGVCGEWVVGSESDMASCLRRRAARASPKTSRETFGRRGVGINSAIAIGVTA